jgi:hypothetical protein
MRAEGTGEVTKKPWLSISANWVDKSYGNMWDDEFMVECL